MRAVNGTQTNLIYIYHNTTYNSDEIRECIVHEIFDDQDVTFALTFLFVYYFYLFTQNNNKLLNVLNICIPSNALSKM